MKEKICYLIKNYKKNNLFMFSYLKINLGQVWFLENIKEIKKMLKK